MELIKEKKIVQEWTTTQRPKDYPPLALELSFISKEDGTELIMTHSRVPAEQVQSYKQGWIEYYWEPIKKEIMHVVLIDLLNFSTDIP